MMIPSSAATSATAAAAATAATAATKPNYVCAAVFPSTADASHTSFLKRKRGDMMHYASAARNALCFFASSSRAANKCDRADARPERVTKQLMDHGLVPEAYGGDTMFVQVSALRKVVGRWRQ